MTKYAGFEDLERDEKLESEIGKKVPFGNGVSITVLRAGGSNTNFLRTYNRVTRPVRRLIDSNKLPYQQNLELHAQIYAESVVIAWEGIRDKDTGEEIPCTKEEVQKFLVNMPDAFMILREYAEDMETFRAEQIDEEVQQLGN